MATMSHDTPKVMVDVYRHNRRVNQAILVVLLGIGGAWFCGMRFAQTTGYAAPPAPIWTVYFSPHGGARAAIVARLAAATDTVEVMALTFNDSVLYDAVLAAHRRGLAVRMVVDDAQRRGVPAQLAALGVPVRFDDRHALLHDKVMVIDARTVITGSYNFSAAAEEHNAENLLVVDDPALAARYHAHWAEHWGHAGALTATR